MFCNQCEQTAKGVACTVKGVCGKTADIADLQDLLMHAVRGVAHFANEGRKIGVIDHELDRFILKAIFATLTNVNFDEARFQELINECVRRRDQLKDEVEKAGGKVFFDDPATTFKPAGSIPELIKQGQQVGQVWIQNWTKTANPFSKFWSSVSGGWPPMRIMRRF